MKGLMIMEKLDVIIVGILAFVYHIFLRISGNYNPQDNEKDDVDDDNSEIIRRISLRKALKKGMAILSPILLQEPTFKQLIILYQKPADQNGRKTHPLYIKAFQNVPMADLELLFPEIRTTLRPIDLIKTTITVCAGIISFIVNMDSDESLLGSVTFLSFLGLAAKTAVDCYFSFYYYEDLTIRFLYNKNTENHSGAILHLTKEVKIQEFKEALLGYFFLLKQGNSTIKELKQACEEFLLDIQKDNHEVAKRVDFEVEDSIAKLQDLGLLIEKDGFLSAIPLTEGIQKIENMWSKLFNEITPLQQ